MNRQKAQSLLEKYLAGQCTPGEKSIVENWYNQLAKYPTGSSVSKEDLALLEKKIYKQLPQRVKNNPKRIRLLFPYAAAVLIFAIILSMVLHRFGRVVMNVNVDRGEISIVPGSNKATLTLADGQVMNLSEEQEGVILKSDDLMYFDGSVLSRFGGIDNDLTTEEVILSTPKGGQYQVVLADGTKVWLNAASSLKYVARSTDEPRIVELDGEAYFEVKAMSQGNKRIPFIVKTANQQVEVLGTHFNVNAYANEKTTKTTLLEGAVRVHVLTKNGINDSKQLKPGQQSVLDEDSRSIRVDQIDISTTVAWKEGLFSFHNAGIQGVMRQFERWYDVVVQYEGKIPSTTFSGKIYRNAEITKVYDLLDYYEIDYQTDGRIITIKGN